MEAVMESTARKIDRCLIVTLAIPLDEGDTDPEFIGELLEIVRASADLETVLLESHVSERQTFNNPELRW
jgi:hypothetical protein